MVNYFRNPAMVYGGEFRCHNCNSLLISKLKGSVYELDLKCPRCHSEITIKMQDPLGKEAIKYFEKKINANTADTKK